MKYWIIIISIVLHISAMAQQKEDNIESQEIIIIKDYKVDLEDGVKMNDAPVTPPAINAKVGNLSYSLPSKLKKLDFDPKPIQPLGYTKTTKEINEENYLKIGFGTQLAPLAEWVHHLSLSKTMKLNLHANHHSAFRSDEGNGYQKYFNNYIKIGLDINSKNTIIKPYIDFKYNHNNMYANDEYRSNNLNIGRNFQKFGLGNDIIINDIKNDVSFTNNIRISTLKDNINNELTTVRDLDFNEYRYGTDFMIRKGIKKTYYVSTAIGIDVSQANAFGKTHRAIFYVMPKVDVNLEKAGFKLSAGLSFTKEIHKMHFLPDMITEKKIIKEKLIFFTGWNIKLNVNYYENMITQNPYLVYVDTIINTRIDNRFGGFKGTVGKLDYVLSFANKKIENQNMYLADTFNSRLFHLINEKNLNMNQLHIAASYDINKEVMVKINTDIFLYDVANVKRAWNMPGVDINGLIQYKPLDKLTIAANIFFKNNIYVGRLDYKEIKVKPIIDLNLNAEYFITKKIAAFITLNNITNRKYPLYYGYNNYGFQGFVGVRLKY